MLKTKAFLALQLHEKHYTN